MEDDPPLEKTGKRKERKAGRCKYLLFQHKWSASLHSKDIVQLVLMTRPRDRRGKTNMHLIQGKTESGRKVRK